jgi:hypothetical protein
MAEDTTDKTVLTNALCSAFPSVESFHDFKETDHEVSARAIPKIIKFAYENGLIEKENEAAFIKFLTANSKVDTDKPFPEEMTFSDVIEILSGNISVNSLIIQLDKISKIFALPKIKASMITRLKQQFAVNTPKKRTLLRVLAYKLAEKHPELNWHYEMLNKITVGTSKISDESKEKAGATIFLHLQGTGEIITPADVNWLKNEIYKCIEYLNLASYVNKKTIITSGATSFSLKLPKKQGPTAQPRLYDRAIRDSLAMAHQLSVRWLLSGLSNPKKNLVIIIHAGLASEASLAIQPILETKLTGETDIYLTSFAYLCARVAEVQVGFELYNKNHRSTDSHINNIWSVKYFWSYNYYDDIPCLLEERMLPTSCADPRYSDFQRALFFPEFYNTDSFEALNAIYMFPQNSLLLIEIANVLRSRQMLYEADAVLSNLLLFKQENVIARIMRMLIYSNIAQAQTDYFVSEMAFERAIAEGEFVKHMGIQDCSIWSELGALYFNRAKKLIKYIRDGNLPHEAEIKREDVMENMEKSREHFFNALATSPTGKDTSAIFWFTYIICFIELFSSDKTLLNVPKNTPFLDNHDAFKKAAMRIFVEMGWVKNELPYNIIISESSFNSLLTTFAAINTRHDNSMVSRCYIPYVKYLFAAFLWDLSPYLNLGIYNTVLGLLNEAITETENLLVPYNLCVYKICQNYVEADKFIEHIQETIDLIKKSATDKDFKTENNFRLNPDKAKELAKIKLMLLELDRY